MPQLTGVLGTWDLPHVHEWRERGVDVLAERRPIITNKSRIATIGSCFAQEIAGAMDRLKLNGAMHPGGLFYTSRTIRQELERIFGGWPGYREEPLWSTSRGFVHPFKDYKKPFASREALAEWSDRLDADAERLFRSANVVVVTLGLIESWRNPKTGNSFRQIPHPEVMAELQPEFYRQTVADILDDLRAIRRVVREQANAELIVTVSPVPLHATFTKLDIRVANMESKSRIRAAVSQFIDEFPDVHYFHAYELVTTAERLSDFMLEDGRHVSRQAVDYILQVFLQQYASENVSVPAVDSSWLTAPTKTATRPAPQPRKPRPLHERVLSRIARTINGR
jgi:GSCFA family